MLDQPLPVVVRPSTEQDVPFMVDIYAYEIGLRGVYRFSRHRVALG